MSWNKTAGRFGLASLGAVAASLVLAGTAVAGPPHTVSVNGNSSAGDSAFTAATKSPGVGFRVHNVAGDVVMGCTSATATGNVHRGPVPTPPRIATITGTTWTGCVSVGLDMTVTQSGPWGIYIDPASQSSSSALTDVITGYIAPTSGTTLAHVADVATGGLLCSFDVVGAADGNFTESAQQLNVTETGGSRNLRVANVSGCLGDIANDDLADFVATYNVTTTGTGINVS